MLQSGATRGNLGAIERPVDGGVARKSKLAGRGSWPSRACGSDASGGLEYRLHIETALLKEIALNRLCSKGFPDGKITRFTPPGWAALGKIRPSMETPSSRERD